MTAKSKPTVSPWVKRAASKTLPASDRTGQIKVVTK